MALRVQIYQNAASTLQRWLTSQLTGVDKVFDRWPEAQVKMPPRHVTITLAGAPSRLDVFTLQAIKIVKIPATTTARVTFELGGIVQPIQLDVWDTTQVGRDDMVAQIEDALLAGTGATLGLANADPVRDGILLPLGGHDSTASANSLVTSRATAVAPAVLTGASFTGTLGPGPVVMAKTDPRNVSVTTSVHAASYILSAPIVVQGLDINSNAMTESLTLTQSGGGETVSGRLFFATITEIDIPAMADALGSFTFGLSDGSYLGNADFLFESPTDNETETRVKRVEYRATYAGEARLAFTITQVVPLMKSLQFKVKTSEFKVAPAGQLYDILTLDGIGTGKHHTTGA